MASSDIRSEVPAGRNPALDFTKGVLVLLMVLYHWINYFVTREGDLYRYLRFITPSFIFITGFLIAPAGIQAAGGVYIPKSRCRIPPAARRESDGGCPNFLAERWRYLFG